jgi:uncharacterized membrane protein
MNRAEDGMSVANQPYRPASSHAMTQTALKPPSHAGLIAFTLLDPIPYGFLVAALIFDAIYAESAEVLWVKASAWLISIGLVFAIVPRLLNLAHVWFPGRRPRVCGTVAAFWLNLFAIATAIVNAFVHSRDAYGVMPEGLLLSCLTIVLLMLAKLSPIWARSHERAAA